MKFTIVAISGCLFLATALNVQASPLGSSMMGGNNANPLSSVTKIVSELLAQLNPTTRKGRSEGRSATLLGGTSPNNVPSEEIVQNFLGHLSKGKLDPASLWFPYVKALESGDRPSSKAQKQAKAPVDPSEPVKSEPKEPAEPKKKAEKKTPTKPKAQTDPKAPVEPKAPAEPKAPIEEKAPVEPKASNEQEMLQEQEPKMVEEMPIDQKDVPKMASDADILDEQGMPVEPQELAE
ncbi:hypothetical protein THASP1DRAFT_22868 [Thamnocephalis sphaerospora]|uniref:Uncharacterized protein n=1 Tax=Thamnocephalis sphaerospora TaxID=78915 RepID=A0A4P9XUX9_9FUNG|nr:hypothetical protein THASP1DRAFT_22868 [Thamnocephalis sphaerospora]|eukprot:RKP09260.1 hypothetical protein THASP1DRAFT_22868 [Thamnocephalis sphaerospora]